VTHTRRIAAGLLLLVVACTALADGGRHFFWEVKGARNSVYFLGSVHMLKPEDSALPPGALKAYETAESLVMELDLNDVDAGALLGAGLESATLPEGKTLPAVLGPRLYARLRTQAQQLGLLPAMLDPFQPWFVAVMISQTSLTKSGFEPASGIEVQLAQRAEADGKPIVGLETMSEQLGFFAQLTLDQQRDYLRSTLMELDAATDQTAELVAAWKRGDTAALEKLLAELSAEAPDLYRRLTTDRNRRWLPRITALLKDDRDHLVVVGAMHLVGKDGLIELVKRQGYLPVQH
jgi:uncharacterized protein YbaP (TraB family)